MTTSTKPLRPAATLIVVRDGVEGPEVLLVQRTHKAAFWGGAHAFPGGAVDRADQDCVTQHELDDAAASATLALAAGGASFWVAAIRECFEEASLLFATDASKDLVALPLERAVELRQQLAAGEQTLTGLCSGMDWRLAVDRIAYLAHWVTPLSAARRFDTRFFVAVAPPAQTGAHDDQETIANLWITPRAALAQFESGAMKMATATHTTLRSLSKFGCADDIMAYARSARAITETHPRVSVNSRGRKVLLPEDFAYAEISKVDPEGLGTFFSEIIPGSVMRLSPHVRRIAAPNPGFMTGPGTNSYLVGDSQALAVIDPGPDIESHLAAIAQEGGAAIRFILTTHTHRDHSPGAARLKELTGAEVIGMPSPVSEFQDPTFRPDRAPHDGERLQVGGITLRVVHTPGHATNHCCYLLEEERLLFTGDHIMQGSTVVINPPDGDMAVYLDSLRKIRGQGIEWLAPGHGFLMDRPDQRIDRLLAHRQAREDKLIQCLQAAGPITANDLVQFVYDDVPAERHGMAFRSLSAHLQKLQQEQHAIEIDGRWQAA
jgi:glyoxylase-like metal-dependent hydrolase (beta-lactamase superfamily II)/8-oxo-dGTP pyrophosphatase MutT (NUDIX family)